MRTIFLKFIPMKNLVLFIFIIFSYYSQAQVTGCMDDAPGVCNYNPLATQSVVNFNTPVNTGSSMNIAFTQSTLGGLVEGDVIGVFGQNFLNSNDTYGIAIYEGENLALTVYGDDQTTSELDGMSSEDFMVFLVKRELDSGMYAVFHAEISLQQDYFSDNTTPSDYQYSTNGIFFTTFFNVTTNMADCVYVDVGESCDGNCIEGFIMNENGICVYGGCTDPLACNYDLEALEDDGSCVYPELCIDCNGFLVDTDQDGVSDCNEIVGCQDETACNYDDSATDEGPCVYLEDYYNCDGTCLNDFDGDGVCDELEVLGCQDETACNYDEFATEDAPCIYSEDYYNCDGTCLNDIDGDNVCDELEVLGCTDPIAIGYNTLATEDDGTCVYCGSVDFTNNNNFLEVNDLAFEDANGVTISFWAYDDNWALSEDNENTFGYFVDFGSVNNYRYVIRWRDGVKGIQAYYEGAGFQSYQGQDCDGISPEECYTYDQTNATYVIPPIDYIDNSDVYNWYADNNTCSWKNITAVFCSNGIRLYIDGQIVQQSTTGVYYPDPIFSLQSSDTKVIGSDQSGSLPCDMKIDEFRIWSRALSETEIQERIGNNIDINLNISSEQNNNIGKLEGYWKFDSLSVRNQITNVLAVESMPTVFSTQYCDYNCDNYDYSFLCLDNSNNDCDACTPSEGCMDENADNYDPLADIDNGLCFYYGCMDDGMHIWSYIPGLAACNYDPSANVNFLSQTNFSNPCDYPISGYDCDGICLYDCDNDGVCDWSPNHCYDTNGNPILTDNIDNFTLEDISDGIPDCLSFININQLDNCMYNSGQDLINNITLESNPDGVPDCLPGFNYQDYYNPFQTDVDGDGLGNMCDEDDSNTQIGCNDPDACNFDFWIDIPCEDVDNNGIPDCCIFCYLDDCENYPTTYFVSEELEFDGPYDCDGNCSDLNLDGEYDDQDQDNICDMFDNCPNFWNPGQIDADGDGVGDACEQNSSSLIDSSIDYMIYPNPFSDYTIIEFNNNANVITLKVLELSGRILNQFQTQDNMFKLYKSDLARGLYILEIHQNNILVRDILIIE